MVKKYKILLAAGFTLAVAAGLIYGGIKLKEARSYERAEALFAAGDYVAASAEYEKLGRADKMSECAYAYDLSRLERAIALMDEGKLEEAKAEFVILGDFENAAELVTECEYRKAQASFDKGEFSEALRLSQKLGDYSDALELASQAREAMYQQALQLAYECRLDEAMEIFGKILDYRDSQSLYLRCSERIVALLSDWSEPVNYSEYAGMKLDNGTLYWHRIGLVYVPDDAGPETTAMIFYPGGYDQSLANGYMTDYLYGYYGELPNSLMVFCYANGYGSFDAKAEDSYKVLEQAAMENNVFLHDIALIGASNGAYTAAHAAVWFYEHEGIAVKNVVTLDAGQHWESFMPVLSTEDCDVLAKAGTKFTLVEGDGVGMNKLAIQTMVAHRMDVSIAHVKNYGHYSVIYDAMKYGIFNWAMGEGERPEHENYTYIALDKKSTYPN